MKTVLFAFALLVASPCHAIDLRSLKELVPPAQVAKAKKQAQTQAALYLKKQKPTLQKQGDALKLKLAKQLKL